MCGIMISIVENRYGDPSPDVAVNISHNANNIGRDMTPIILPPVDCMAHCTY